VTYNDAVQKIRLVELSDAHYGIGWDLIDSNPPLAHSGASYAIHLRRVTFPTPGTLAEIEVEFSRDASANVLEDARYKAHDFFKHITDGLGRSKKMIQVGDTVPNVVLDEGHPGGKVALESLLAGKKVVLFGAPGAYSPHCSNQLPGFVRDADKLKASGVDLIICTAVNDVFTMAAWGQVHGATGKVRMLADPRAELAKALGLDVDTTGIFGNVRTKRYSALIENKVVKQLHVEPDGFGLTCSLSNGLKL